MTTTMKKRPKSGMPALARAAEMERRKQRKVGRETLRETFKQRGFDFAPLIDEALALGLVDEMARILSSSKAEQMRERGRELLAREYERLGVGPAPSTPMSDEKGAEGTLPEGNQDEAVLVERLLDFTPTHNCFEKVPAEIAVGSAVSATEVPAVSDGVSATNTDHPVSGELDKTAAPNEPEASAQMKSFPDPQPMIALKADSELVLVADETPPALEAAADPIAQRENLGSRWKPGAVAMPAFRARPPVPLPFRATRSGDTAPLDHGQG